MVIGHVVLVAIVIVFDIRLAVVGGVDVELAVEDVGGGVGRVDVGDDWLLIGPIAFMAGGVQPAKLPGGKTP